MRIAAVLVVAGLLVISIVDTVLARASDRQLYKCPSLYQAGKFAFTDGTHTA